MLGKPEVPALRKELEPLLGGVRGAVEAMGREETFKKELMLRVE